MAIERLTLTPEVAKGLLEHLYDKQRKPSKQKVKHYIRALERGEWVSWNPDSPILIDKGSGGMFNGLQRCTAVIESGIAMDVLIDRDSDGRFFDYIDVGLERRPQQFIEGASATARASAARTIIWYNEDFDQLPTPRLLAYPLADVLASATAHQDLLDDLVIPCRASYTATGISQSIQMAAACLAIDAGYPRETVFGFLAKLADPAGLDPNDPAWRLYVRSNNRINRIRHRDMLSNWTVFVRHLNAVLTGDALPAYVSTNLSVWPRIGEREEQLIARGRAKAHAAYDARKRGK